MKIDDSNGKLPLPSATGTAGRSTVSRTDAPAVSKPADKVSLSGSGKALASTAEAPIDLAKVEQIRAAIADGSFRLDADRIADGVIAASRDLMRRG